MKKLLITIFILAFSLNAKAEFSPFYQMYAKDDGDTEALYAYDDMKLGYYPNIEAALKRLKTSAVSVGAETETEVNAYLNIALQEMNRKLNLYKSLAN
jgi:hypothetical protein